MLRILEWKTIVIALIISFLIDSTITAIFSYTKTLKDFSGLAFIPLILLLLFSLLIIPIIVGYTVKERGIVHSILTLFLLVIMGIIFLAIFNPETILGFFGLDYETAQVFLGK